MTQPLPKPQDVDAIRLNKAPKKLKPANEEVAKPQERPELLDKEWDCINRSTD